MQLGSDFFKWFKLLVAIIKLLIETFGNDNDKTELRKNHIEP